MNTQTKNLTVMPATGGGVASISNVKDLIFNPPAMDQMYRLSEIMASTKCTIPAHLQNKPGDCFAIVMQAAQWGMNPFSVAQKTHIVNGTLGYEAQLVNSVINAMAPIKGRLKFEWRGNWDKYITGGMKKEDETGLHVVVSGVLQGEDKPTELSVYLAPQSVRNSPLWKTDPKQQLAYLGIKKWARLHCPDVIQGVYTPDEIEEFPVERVINPRPEDLKAPPTCAELVDKIKGMAEADLTQDKMRDWDLKPYTEAELRTIRGEVTLRRKQLKEASVVAHVEPAGKNAAPSDPPATGQAADRGGDEDQKWQQLLDNATAADEVNAIFASMPDDVMARFGDAVDMKLDELRGGGNGA